MREILFRGKRKDNEDWVEGFYFCMVHDDGSHVHHFIMPLGVDLSLGTPIEKIQVEVNPETVCQYTEWGNENDRKIFEGDIIKVDDSWIGIVVWDFNDTSFNVEPVYDDMEEVERLGVVINGNDVEVIGNIFDNPELIDYMPYDVYKKIQQGNVFSVAPLEAGRTSILEKLENNKSQIKDGTKKIRREAGIRCCVMIGKLSDIEEGVKYANARASSYGSVHCTSVYFFDYYCKIFLLYK